MSCCQQNPVSGLGAPLDTPSALPAPSTWPQGCPLIDLELARMPRRKDGTEVKYSNHFFFSFFFKVELFLEHHVTQMMQVMIATVKDYHLACLHRKTMQK